MIGRIIQVRDQSEKLQGDFKKFVENRTKAYFGASIFEIHALCFHNTHMYFHELSED